MLISSALQLASLGAKLGSGIANVVRSAKEKKELQNQKNELESWYGAESNKDYVDTDQAQSVLKKLRESLAKRQEVVDNTAAVMGGTTEAQLAQGEQNNEALSDTMSGIAGQGTVYKEGLRRDYMDRKDAINQRLSQLRQNQIQSAVNAGANAMTAFGGVSDADKMDAFGGKSIGSLFGKIKSGIQNNMTGGQALQKILPSANNKTNVIMSPDAGGNGSLLEWINR